MLTSLIYLKGVKMHGVGNFYRHDGYLFKSNKLCIPRGFMCDLLVLELHECSLAGHFGVTKILGLLREIFISQGCERM